MRFSSGYSGSTSLPPPPNHNGSLFDTTPGKSRFLSSMGMSSACAFPSWPNRPSLLRPQSEETSASAYLSDEDLSSTDLHNTPPSESSIDEETAASNPVYLPSGAGDFTTEEQIQMMRAAAGEHVRFLAYVHAHARSQQAVQLAAAERENAKPNKKECHVANKKHRSSTKASGV